MDPVRTISDEQRFSAAAWARNTGLYATMRDIPFIAELLEGRLEIARFRHYVVQDAKYLIGFGQALALAAAKADQVPGLRIAEGFVA